MELASSIRARERGYSLVETLIATALLGTVLISIMTLFVFGRRNVYSGKQMTSAVAAATVVSEDLSVLNIDDVKTFFELTGKAPGDNPVAGDTYTNSVIVSTTTTLTNTNGLKYRNKWVNLMSTQKFRDGKITLVFRPYLDEDPSTIAGANILQVRAVVEWKEARRSRKVVVDTVKLDRTKNS